MRARPWLSPLVLLSLSADLAACTAPPIRGPAPTFPPAPAPTPVASTPLQRFADPSQPVPAFADPERRAKLLAVVPRLDAHFAEHATRAHMPGLAVGLVVDGELVWSKGYGVRDLASGQPVDADTLFRLASVTKSFTAMAVLQLRDEGKLSLDDPADRYLPELAGLVYPTRDAGRITLRHLLTHNGGLPHDPPVPIDETRPPPSDADVLASLQGLTLENAGFSYSNLGFMLAGMVVSRVSGIPYGDYMTSRVLRPLGMTSTGFAPPPDRLATGYVLHGDKPEHPGMLNLGANPAGGLFASVRDLGRYAAFQLSAWPPRDDADDGPLRRSSVREAQRMATYQSLFVAPRPVGKPQSASATGYGFGWGAQETCDFDTVVWHNGALSDGYLSMVLLLPDRGVALVALTNLFDDHAGLDGALNDAVHMLDDSGALARLVLSPSPALVATRDAIMGLRERWDEAVARRLFPVEAPGFSIPELREDVAKDGREHGACHIVSTAADGPARLRWETACDRGGHRWRLVLDAKDQRIADLHVDEAFPPDPRLAGAALRLAPLVGRWDDRVYDALVGSAAERPKVKAAFAEAASAHGSCKVGRADDHGDKTHAHFLLSCARGGALELHAALDDKSGKVTMVALTVPAEPGKKCP